MNRTIIVIALGLLVLTVVAEAIIHSFTSQTTTAQFYALGLTDEPAAAQAQPAPVTSQQ